MNSIKRVVVSAVACVVLCAFSSLGDVRTWAGNGPDALWLTLGNWDSGVPAGGDSLVFGGNKSLAPVNDLAVGTSFAGITFGAGAGAFTLSGNGLVLGGNLVNNSSEPQTLDMPVTVNAARTINVADGDIFLNSLDFNVSANTTITKSGTNELVFTGTSVMPTSDYRMILVQNGILRFAGGSVFTMPSSGGGNRNILSSGTAANQQAKVIIEPGADVMLGNFNIQTTGAAGNTFDLLVDGGKLHMTGGDNSFGDQGGSTMSVSVINGGGLWATNSGDFNAGTRSPLAITIDNGTFAVNNLCFGRSTSGGGDRNNGKTVIDLIEGAVTVNGTWELDSAGPTARTNTISIGDGRIGKATMVLNGVKRTNLTATNIMNFNGGQLVMRVGVTMTDFFERMNIHEGGAYFNITNTVLNTAPMLHAPGLPSGTFDGGVIKRGSGSLTLNSWDSTFDGPIRVEDGTLRISAQIPSDRKGIYVAEGKTLSFRGSRHQVLRPDQVIIGGATSDTTLEFDVNADGSDPDTIRLPLDTSIGKLRVALYERVSTGVETHFNGAGDFVLFTYVNEPPDITLWTHGNLQTGHTSSFIVDRTAKSVILRIVKIPALPSQVVYEWLNPLGGSWDIQGNWKDTAIPADSPYSWCRLWDVLSTPSTVTLNRAATIRGLSFRGPANAYTLSGKGPLTLAHSDGHPAIVVDTGTHTVDVPITLTQRTHFNGTASTARLNLTGPISGTGPVRIIETGTVSMTGANTFTGGLFLDSARLEVSAAAPLSTGLITFNGGTLAALDTFTAPNPWAIALTSTVEVASTKTLSLGDLASAVTAQYLYKTGEGTLELYGVADIPNNAQLNLRAGTMRLTPTADYAFRVTSGAVRDMVQANGLAANTPLLLELQPGARFFASLHVLQGITTLLIDSAAWTTPDGTDTQLMDSGSGSLDMRVTGNNGLFRVGTGPLNMGIHGFGKFTIDNGGIISGSRITLVGNGAGVSARNGWAEVNVASGGTFEAREALCWLTSNVDGKTADLNLLPGGLAILPATVRNSSSLGHGIATVRLDGGTLRCPGLPIYTWTDAGMSPGSLADYLYGVDRFVIGEDGGAVDTLLNTLTITQPLAFDAGVLTPGTFTKLGGGMLTLSGGIADPVSLNLAEGTLIVGGPSRAFTHVTVASGATLVMADTWAVSGTLTLASGPILRWDGPHTPGTYTLATLGAFSGNPSAIGIANALPGQTYALVISNNNALELIIGAPSNAAQWANDVDGAWDSIKNWTPQNVPDGIGHAATFADIFTQPRLVSLNSPVTLSGLTFGAQLAPVLQGLPLTFQSVAGNVPGVQVAKGAPVISTPLVMPGKTAVAVAQGASLTLTCDVTGTGPLDVSGPGTLAMTTNLATAVNVSGATLALNSGSRFAAPVHLDRGGTLMALESIRVAMPITVGNLGGTLALVDSNTVAVASTITGSGWLTRLGNGTHFLPVLPDVNLALGKGTLLVTSTVAQVWAKALNTSADGGIATLRHVGEITLAGPVNGTTRFIKAGPGTLRYTYPGAMALCQNNPAATDNTLFDFGPHGEAPQNGPYSYNILEGTVVMGVPGQAITLTGNVLVGGRTTTTPGAETEGHLVINDGTVTVTSTLNIARGNGTTVTAPTPLSSSVTVNGGTLTANGNIAMGAFAGLSASEFNARPRLTVNNGRVVTPRLLVPEVAGCTATATINGGEVRLSNDLVVGNNSAGTGNIIINDGLLYVQNAINLGNTAGTTGTLHIAGGTVDVQNVVSANTAANTHTLILFNGGLFCPRVGPLSLKEARVLAHGLRIQTPANGYSLATPFTDPGLQSDAGLTKTGTGYLALNQPLLYKGPTVIEEGRLDWNTPDALPATPFTMRPGTALNGPAFPALFRLAGLTLGAAAAEPVAVRLYANAQTNDCFAVNGPAVLGEVAFTLCSAGSTLPVPFIGTYTLVTYTGADPATSGLSVANPMDGYSYTFSAGSGKLTLTISDNPSSGADFIWNTGDGNWNTAQSWLNTAVPLATAKAASFPWQAGPVTVTVDTAATVGGLMFGSGGYTLAGFNTLTLNAGAAQPNIYGASTVYAPLALANSAEASLQPFGGRLTLGGGVTGPGAALSVDTAGQVRVESNTVAVAVNLRNASGVLEVADAADITGNVQFFNGRIDGTGNGAISGALNLQPGQRQVNASAGSTLTLGGPVLGSGALAVSGGGRVTLAAPNNYRGGTTVQNATLALRAPATPGTGGTVTMADNNSRLATDGTGPVTVDQPVTLTANMTFDTPAAPLSVPNGIAFSPATTLRTINKVGADEVAIGGTFSYSNNNTVVRAIYVSDGFLRFLPGTSFTLLGDRATSGTADGNIRSQVRANSIEGSTGGFTIDPGAELTLSSIALQYDSSALIGNLRLLMNAATLNLRSCVPLCFGDQGGADISVQMNDSVIYANEDDSWADIGTRSKVYWTLDGDSSVSLGRAAFGRQDGAGGNRAGGGTTLVISNGLWEARTAFSWKSTDDNNSVSTVTVGCGEPLQGVFSVPPTIRPHTGGQVIFNQDGGILRALPLPTIGGAAGSAANFLNGINAWNVGPGGAAVDVPDESNAITITHAMTLASGHGGFTKLGPGTLTLTQGLAVTGTVTVADGTLKANATAAPGLHLGPSGTLDLAQTGAGTFKDVSGTGTATNGTLSASGTLSPGETDGEAGTLHAENLTLNVGATFRYDWTSEANDLLAVSGTFDKTGPVTVDFGREENPLTAPTLPFTCVLGSYGSLNGNVSGGWKVKNTGLPSRVALNATVTAQDGILTLRVTPGGMLMIIR